MTEPVVAVAIRKTDILGAPSRGSLSELGLAVLDPEGNIVNLQAWPIFGFANLRFALDPRMANMVQGDAIPPGVDVGGGQRLSAVIEEAMQWWDRWLGTSAYSNPKPVIVGLRPEVTRAWLVHHTPPLAECLGDSLDLVSAAWATGLNLPEPEEHTGEELVEIAALLKGVLDCRRTLTLR